VVSGTWLIQTKIFMLSLFASPFNAGSATKIGLKSLFLRP
jgi:hypothetical protein